MGFELTEEKVIITVWISIAAAIASCFICLLVLGAAAWIYSKPYARHTIDRVSFRLFLWSMVFEVVYDASFIADGLVSLGSSPPHGPCATVVYIIIGTLGVVNFLWTCIAVNLMLIVCFKVDTAAKRLERWYVGISIFLGLGIPITPAALGHFGWDPIINVCWIKTLDDTTRMRFFVLDLHLWQILSCVIATTAVIMTLVTLFRYRRASSTSAAKGEGVVIDLERDTGCAKAIFDQLETKFLNITCRIALYPITLIVVNGIITIGDLYVFARQEEQTYSIYCLSVVYNFLYGGRGMFLVFLGVFVDSCLRNGLKVVWRGEQAGYVHDTHGGNNPLEKQTLMDILGAPTQVLGYHSNRSAEEDSISTETPRSREGSKGSLDLCVALARLPGEVPSHRSPARHRQSSYGCTKSFSGVNSASLPHGLTDEVDVQRMGNWERGGRLPVEEEEQLDELTPDLPNPVEEIRRRQKADKFAQEEAVRYFEETRAQL